MRPLHALFVILLLLVAAPHAQALGGDVQVTCASGYRVYIDEEFVGMSTGDEDGKYIAGLSPGSHTLKVEKSGFSPYEKRFSIGAGKTIEIRVGTLSRQLTVTQTGDSESGGMEQRVGSLKIQSAPLRCTIKFLGQTIDKTKAEVDISGIPVGTHDVTFSRDSKVLKTSVTIEQSETKRI